MDCLWNPLELVFYFFLEEQRAPRTRCVGLETTLKWMLPQVGFRWRTPMLFQEPFISPFGWRLIYLLHFLPCCETDSGGSWSCRSFNLNPQQYKLKLISTGTPYRCVEGQKKNYKLFAYAAHPNRTAPNRGPSRKKRPNWNLSLLCSFDI